MRRLSIWCPLYIDQQQDKSLPLTISCVCSVVVEAVVFGALDVDASEITSAVTVVLDAMVTQVVGTVTGDATMVD